METPKQVRTVLVTFWKTVLRMSRAAHPPQLHDVGDRSTPDHKCPTRNFPTAGSWQVQPPAVSLTPPPLHLHLWHYLSNTVVCVPLQRIAQLGAGEMLYWFHHGVWLPEHVRWATFVKQQPSSCYATYLPTAAAAGLPPLVCLEVRHRDAPVSSRIHRTHPHTVANTGSWLVVHVAFLRAVTWYILTTRTCGCMCHLAKRGSCADVLASVVRVLETSGGRERRHSAPIPSRTPPRQDGDTAQEYTTQPTDPHSTRATHTEGHWDTGHQPGGTALCVNATADEDKTSTACTLAAATPTPSAIRPPKTTGVP